MAKIILLPADVYVVINKTLLNDQDRRLLSMLYQPIVGSIAINLYFTFWSYLDKSEMISYTWTHHHLMSSMQLNLNSIAEAREKLEAIGLIKTYLKEGNINTYIYELYSPISADEFLNNPILSTTLYSSIGSEEYQKIANYFKLPKIELTNYKNVTSSFNEVFEIGRVIDMPNEETKRRVQKLGINFEPNIDLDGVLGLIPKELLNYKSVTSDIKELIYRLSFVYNFNDDMINEVIRNSIDEKHKLDVQLLQENSRKCYQFEMGNKLPHIIYRNQPEYLRKPLGDTSPKAKMIYQFENMTPYDFLVSKNGGIRLSSSDVALLKILLIDMELMPGVVNVLIDYVLKINNNKLNKAFVETIAGQWKRCSVKTVSEAMQLAEAEYKGKKGNKKVVKTEKKPDWFDKQIDVDVASKEEQEEFMRKLKVG